MLSHAAELLDPGETAVNRQLDAPAASHNFSS
jgi:hypothetical protein